MPKGLGDVPDLGEFIIQDVEKRQTVPGNVCEDFSWEKNAAFVTPPCHDQ